MFAVYKGAGEHDVPTEIRCFPAELAALPHLVLHRLHLLHRGVAGVSGGWSTELQIWQVSGIPSFTTWNESSDALGSNLDV